MSTKIHVEIGQESRTTVDTTLFNTFTRVLSLAPRHFFALPANKLSIAIGTAFNLEYRTAEMSWLA